MTTSRRRLGAFWRGALGSLMNGERPLETLHRALSLQFSTSRQIQLILHYVPSNAGEPITPYRSVVFEMRGRLVPHRMGRLSQERSRALRRWQRDGLAQL